MITKDITPNEEIIVIPRHALLNIETVGPLYEPTYKRDSPSVSAHQLLALHLTLESQRPKSTLKPFIDALPSDFHTLPLTWSQELIDIGPWWFQHQVALQRKKFNEDWRSVLAFINVANIKADISHDDFLWAWLCVNTRCLYMQGLSTDRRDNMTMAPLIDMINHDSKAGTDVNIRENGFVFHTLPGKSYQAGQELFLPYGCHDNIFLLVEYGFTLPSNSCSYVKVDNEVQALAESRGKLNALRELENNGYFGDWSFDAEPSFRLLVAMRWLALHIGDGQSANLNSHLRVKGSRAHKVSKVDKSISVSSEDRKLFQQMLRGERESVTEQNERLARDLLCELLEKVHLDASDAYKKLISRYNALDDPRIVLLGSLWTETISMSKTCLENIQN